MQHTQLPDHFHDALGTNEDSIKTILLFMIRIKL